MRFVSLALFVENFSSNKLDLWMQVREETGKFKGFWEFPGGHIEKGETPLIAAIREVEEEVGIIIAEENITKLNDFVHQFDINNKIHFFTFIVKNAKPEKDKGKWFSINLDHYEKSFPEKTPPVNGQLVKALCSAFKNIDQEDFDLVWTK